VRICGSDVVKAHLALAVQKKGITRCALLHAAGRRGGRHLRGVTNVCLDILRSFPAAAAALFCRRGGSGGGGSGAAGAHASPKDGLHGLRRRWRKTGYRAITSGSAGGYSGASAGNGIRFCWALLASLAWLEDSDLRHGWLARHLPPGTASDERRHFIESVAVCTWRPQPLTRTIYSRSRLPRSLGG